MNVSYLPWRINHEELTYISAHKATNIVSKQRYYFHIRQIHIQNDKNMCNCMQCISLICVNILVLWLFYYQKKTQTLRDHDNIDIHMCDMDL